MVTIKWSDFVILQVRATSHVISISFIICTGIQVTPPMSVRSLRQTKQRPDARTSRHWIWALWTLRNRDDHTYRGMPRLWQTDAKEHAWKKENVPRCFHRDKCPQWHHYPFFATYKSISDAFLSDPAYPHLTPYGHIDSPTVYNRLSAVQHGPGNDEGIVV